MKSKKLVLIFLTLFCLIFGGISLVIFFVDPLRIFHKPIICKNSIEIVLRLGDKTLIDHYEFDSVILGTSMLENTSSAEASEILGGKFMNLSIAGGDFLERSLILNYAHKKKNLKKIIYSLDPDKFLKQRKGDTTYSPLKFYFLYDDNKFNDFKVYFDKYMLTRVGKNLLKCNSNNVDRVNAWFEMPEHKVRFGGFENWLRYKASWLIGEETEKIIDGIEKIKSGEIQSLENLNEQIVNSKKYVDDYLLKFVANEPDTEFLIVVPPYSRIHNHIEIRTKPNDFLTTKEVLRYLVQKSSEFKNLKIYAWGDSDYPDDIANYKDLTHYSHKFNSLMLSYIRDGIGLLTPENFDAYYAEFEKKSLEFDIMPYYEKIKDFIK